jgi:hypothetical protein
MIVHLIVPSFLAKKIAMGGPIAGLIDLIRISSKKRIV